MKFYPLILLLFVSPVIIQAQGGGAGKKLLKGFERYDEPVVYSNDGLELSQLQQNYYDSLGHPDSTIFWYFIYGDAAHPRQKVNEKYYNYRKVKNYAIPYAFINYSSAGICVGVYECNY